jgi:hypothetical protein
LKNRYFFPNSSQRPNSVEFGNQDATVAEWDIHVSGASPSNFEFLMDVEELGFNSSEASPQAQDRKTLLRPVGYEGHAQDARFENLT